MAKGVVTITTCGPTGMGPGDRVVIGTTDGTHTYWVVGRKSATELIIASTWRDSLWVLWFRFVAWLAGCWQAIRSRYRRDDDFGDDEGEGPVLVVPGDSADDVDPKTLN